MLTQSKLMTEEVVLAAIAVHEAQKRIPDHLKTHSFFSKMDVWQFIAIIDDRTCDVCLPLDTRFFTGDELRSNFTYLDILDEVVILAKVHPNCRCVLNRIYEPSHYISLTEPISEEP